MKGKLGPPPPRLVVLPDDLLPYDGDLWRVQQIAAGRSGWNALRHYGPVPGMRFDPHRPPPGPDRPEGVQYCSTTALTALAEAFQRGRRIVTTRSDLLLVGWAPIRDLRLLDVNGGFGVRNGGAATLAAGSKRYTQAWARAIHDDRPDLDGMWHRSAMTGDDLVTLMTRCETHPVWPSAPMFQRRLDDGGLRGLLLAAAETIGYDVG